jgi:hypothetical protein
MYDWKYYITCAKELKDGQIREAKYELKACALELKECNNKLKWAALLGIFDTIIIIVIGLVMVWKSGLLK